MNESNAPQEQVRIVQETVAGKEITLAHIIGGPAPIVYVKLGLNPNIDYHSSAIGIMNMTPPESVVIASDIAVKSGEVYLGFADRDPDHHRRAVRSDHCCGRNRRLFPQHLRLCLLPHHQALSAQTV